ncbi:MAG: hypothetical protein AB7O97_13685 [Planctomycetota bacterium]
MTDPIDHRPLPTGAVAGANPAAPRPAAPAAGDDSPAFRRLLESLEQLARPEQTPPEVHDPESLKEALASADDGFQQVMDLRRRLEDAFRQRAQ